MFLPFFFFEIRHGFEQTKTALNALAHGGGGLVTVHGLTKPQIVHSFFMHWTTLLQIPFELSLVILITLAVIFALLLAKKKVLLSKPERTLLLFLFSLAVGCLGLYLSVHNPVWEYHFTGLEIFWLLLLGIFLTKIPLIKYVAYGGVLILLIMQILAFSAGLHTSLLATGSLVTKEYIVKTIAKDAGGKTYTVYAYSPSIYIYEYTYLFRWLAGKDVPYDPGAVVRKGNVYLILPPAKKSALDDFINYRTPAELYKTIETLSIPDGTIIIKRSLE
jgi:hypothetical protein